jgi:hypothetical protein
VGSSASESIRRSRSTGWSAPDAKPVSPARDSTTSSRSAKLLFPLGGDLEPGDKTLDGAVGDVLYAYSRRMEVGTRVDLFGHQTPELIHAVLAALAEAPPWMRGPVWD